MRSLRAGAAGHGWGSASNSAMTTSSDLPDYENPPLIEVVCGVLFRPIKGLLAPHLGLLWQKYSPPYSGCQEVAPLAPLREQLEGEGAKPAELEFGEVPPLPRVWFVHEKGRGVIQVQRDRFLHNWRKLDPADEYPRYHNVIGLFRGHLETLEGFLAEKGLGEISPLQYEMTYINLIPVGEGWTSLADIGAVLPDLSWRSNADRFLPSFEGCGYHAGFLLPNRAGRLHVVLRTGRAKQDGRPVLQLELTTRGMGADTSRAVMWNWFDLAHEWIVRGFTDLTGGGFQQQVWKRTR